MNPVNLLMTFEADVIEIGVNYLQIIFILNHLIRVIFRVIIAEPVLSRYR
jgi:hypothetical protein